MKSEDKKSDLTKKVVTTRAVVWIEISISSGSESMGFASPPVRWCGLKLEVTVEDTDAANVTTRAVVWIEIDCSGSGADES